MGTPLYYLIYKEKRKAHSINKKPDIKEIVSTYNTTCDLIDRHRLLLSKQYINILHSIDNLLRYNSSFHFLSMKKSHRKLSQIKL